MCFSTIAQILFFMPQHISMTLADELFQLSQVPPPASGRTASVRPVASLPSAYWPSSLPVPSAARTLLWVIAWWQFRSLLVIIGLRHGVGGDIVVLLDELSLYRSTFVLCFCLSEQHSLSGWFMEEFKDARQSECFYFVVWCAIT